MMEKNLIRIIIATFLFTIIFITDLLVDLANVFSGKAGLILPLILYGFVYLLVGYDVIWKAGRNIFRGQFLDENFLMVLATFGAFGLAIFRGLTGQKIEGFDEACAVLLFYQIGEWLQGCATEKSRDSITHLINLRPDYANLLIEGKIVKIDPSEVAVGSIIVVNPGEKVPLDGIVLHGVSDLDTKSLTGEALPKTVKHGDEVLSGCINLTTQIQVQVTKNFYDSTVSKILDLVENASMQKSKSENFITKFARFYTPVVVFTAVLLVFIIGIVTNNWGMALYRALSFLVVSCPCALVISVPLSFFIALGVASKRGILIKGSNYLEKLNQTRIFVFDKTGTLTKGNFAITTIEPQTKKESILAAAAIAEKNSHHPIAKVIVDAYGKKIPNGWTLQNVAGNGIIAVNGDDVIYCGNAQLLQKYKIKFEIKEEKGTIIYVARNQEYLGYIILQDEIKPESKAVLEALANFGQNIMLTGDNGCVAAAVAANLNLTSYQANLLPQDKVSSIENLMTNHVGAPVCFVGDGINDAPVLTRADVGISMGGIGSDAAVEAADVILMHDDLRGILTAKKIAKKTMKIVRQNIVVSLLVKFGILFLSVCGITNLWWAIFGDVGVALLTILNAFRVSFMKKD